VLRIVLIALLLLFSASLAQAAVCTVHVGDLDFGRVDAIGNDTATTSADVTISCDSITPGTTRITMCGNLGAGGGGEVGGVRQSLAGSGALGFVLYTGSGTSVPWGSTTSPDLGAPNSIDIPVSGTTADLTTRLNGAVPANQATAPVGTYRANFSSSDAVFTYAEGDLDCSAPVGGTDALASFAVTAEIVDNCLLQTANLDFGTAGLIGDNIDADTAMSLTCTPGTHYAISIDGGRSGDPDNRLLYSGANTVRYGLYANSGHTIPWGVDSGETVSGTGTGADQQYGVYGRIPPQPASAGSYADTVVVTITY
jgi:spore coat protein U-like protein